MLRRGYVAVVLAGVLGVGGAIPARAAAPALVLFDAAARHLTVAYAGCADVPLAALLPEARRTLAARCAGSPDCAAETALDVLASVFAAAGDRHTRLLAPDALARFVEAQRGAALRAGVGLVVRSPTHGLGLVVLDVAPNTPAAAAGFERGDRIVRLDAAWLPAPAVERRAAWDAAVATGTVLVGAVRAGLGSFEARLESAPVPVDRPPNLAWSAGGVAWLRVPSLLPLGAVAPAVHRMVAEAREVGASALVLDLRDDVGGAYDAAVTIAGAFVDEVERVFLGPAACVGLRFHDGVLDTYDPLGTTHAYEVVPGAERWARPVVVLVNARTSSAAEALAYDLQQAGIPVVGEATAGMANAAVVMVRLPEGYGLVLTVALAVGVDGAPLPARVVPDLLVPDDAMALAAGHDRVLEAALRLLAGWR